MNLAQLADGSIVVAALGILASAAITYYRVKLNTRKLERLSADFYNHHDDRAIHRDPERDGERWKGLLNQVDESRSEICRRLDRLEQYLIQIKLNGATAVGRPHRDS